MADLKTTLSNIYEPTIWEPAFVQLTTDKNALVQSGIAAADTEVVDAANKGGRIVEMPFWNDLPNDENTAETLSSVGTTTDAVITPSGMTQGVDIAAKHFRNKAWNVSPIVKYAEGSDPVKVALDRYANWWVAEEQRIMQKILGGIFLDATIAAALSLDISGEESTSDAAKLIGSSAIEDARFLLGDAYAKFTGMLVHSVHLKRLRNLGLITDVPVQDQNPLAEPIPYYMGLRVFVDDKTTKTAGSTSGYKYDAFLFGAGAFARTEVALDSTEDPKIEVYREPLKGTGSGSTSVITRRAFILHPRGIAWTGTAAGVSPSDAELASDNWTKAWDTKNIRIARLRTNG
jgi:hypothetical protein